MGLSVSCGRCWRDWILPAPRIARRLIAGAGDGGIFCLHDGRERRTNPDIRATLDAVREAVPRIWMRVTGFGRSLT